MKATLSVICLLAAIMSIQTSHADCVSPGMIGWWQAEGNALDSAGTNHGTISGATFTSGKVGQSFSLDGTGHVSLGTQVGNFGAADFTLEFWLASTNGARLDVILGKRSICGIANFWNLFLRPDGRVNVEWCSGLSGTFNLDSATHVNNGLYHHVAWRREGTNYSLSIDGVMEAAMGLPLVNFNNPAALLIGNNPCVGPGGATRLIGQVDELALHNRALSLAELQAISNAGSLGHCGLGPTLNITALPGAVRLTWTTNATGYFLETNGALTFPSGWGVLTSNYSVLNTNYAVTNAIAGTTRFYRLHRP